MKYWVIDRIEGEYAIVEVEEDFLRIPLALLPEVTEGDQIEIRKKESTDRIKEAEERLKRLKQNSPQGTIIDL